MAIERKTILVVEDNPDNRCLVRDILEHFGFSVVEAENGAEGIQKARVHRPDLVLMDLSMPVMDGWRATELLKQDRDTEHIPVLALTAHTNPEFQSRARQQGFDAYLTKPIPPRHLLHEVEQRIGPATEPRG